MKCTIVSIVGALCFLAGAWLAYLFFEGDACADAGGGAITWLGQCSTAPGETYTPMYRNGTWIFWVLYGIASIVVGWLIAALLAGIVFGLRSFWFDVIVSSRS
jgi:hypothetical protein